MSITIQLAVNAALIVLIGMVAGLIYFLIKKKISLKMVLFGIAQFLLIRMILQNSVLSLIAWLLSLINIDTSSPVYLLAASIVLAIGRVFGQFLLNAYFKLKDSSKENVISIGTGYAVGEITVDYANTVLNNFSIVGAIVNGTLAELVPADYINIYADYYMGQNVFYYLFPIFAIAGIVIINIILSSLILDEEKADFKTPALIAIIFYCSAVFFPSVNHLYAIIAVIAAIFSCYNLYKKSLKQ